MEEHSSMASPDRDRVAAEMLRRSLAQDPGSGLVCPDAEIVAAYCECSLDPEETARFELHLSQCARCREQVAAMSRAGEIAVSDEAESSRASSGIWGWRWLAPVAAVLILGAVWAIRRPSLPGTSPRSPSAILQSKEAPPISPLGAGSNLPASSAAAPRKKAEPGSNPSALGESANNEVAQNQTDAMKDRESNPLEKTHGGIGSDSLARDSAGVTAPARMQSPIARPAPGPLARPAGAPSSGASDNLTAQAEVSGNSEDLKAKQLSGPAKVSHFAAENKVVTGLLIPTPDPQILWRLRDAGYIERSIDGGATWHGQLPRPNASLLAGSAPSEQVCWVVGKGGMILLTEDATTWTKMPPPVAADLVAVMAKDARTVKVTLADGREFSTVDAGKNWSPAP
jgi:hypothetical protein